MTFANVLPLRDEPKEKGKDPSTIEAEEKAQRRFAANGREEDARARN